MSGGKSVGFKQSADLFKADRLGQSKGQSWLRKPWGVLPVFFVLVLGFKGLPYSEYVI